MNRLGGICLISVMGMAFPDLSLAAGAARNQDWNGVYIGVQGGAGKVSTRDAIAGADWNYCLNNPRETCVLSAAFNDQMGGLLGIRAGYNWQLNALLLGAEVDYQAGRIKGSNLTAVDQILPSTDLSGLVSLSGRLGFATGRTVFFVRGGVALADVKTSLDELAHTGSDDYDIVGYESQAARIGWMAGGGIERKVFENWTVGIQYAHYDFGTKSFSAVEGPDFDLASPIAYSDYRYQAALTADVVSVGISYQF